MQLTFIHQFQMCLSEKHNDNIWCLGCWCWLTMSQGHILWLQVNAKIQQSPDLRSENAVDCTNNNRQNVQQQVDLLVK